MIAKGSPLDRAINGNNSNVSYYASQLKDALLDAVAETPTGRAKTAADYVQNLNRYQTARGQYKNMKILENLAEKSPTGDVNPTLLMNEVRKSYGDFAYGGGGDLGALGRIGQRFLREPPSSGTTERAAALLGLGAGAEGLYYWDPEDFQRNVAIGLTGLGLARGVGSVLRGNSMLGGPLANALIANAPGMPQTPFAANLANRFSRASPLAALLYRRSQQPTFDQRWGNIPVSP
jgi:hypothetical protein